MAFYLSHRNVQPESQKRSSLATLASVSVLPTRRIPKSGSSALTAKRYGVWGNVTTCEFCPCVS